MSLFGALPIAASGATAMQTWIDTSAGNIANADDVVPTSQPAYAPQTPILTPITSGIGGTGGSGEGVAVTGIALGDSTGSLAYEPGSPLADANGEVRVPNVSMGSQLVGLIQAQESYQADTVVIARAKTAYAAGLSIGS